MADPLTWRFNPEFALHRRTWGDDVIVFHEGSGDTHLLDELGAEALRSLQERPGTADALTHRLAPVLGLEHAELAEHLGRLLAEFDDLGLIEPMP